MCIGRKSRIGWLISQQESILTYDVGRPLLRSPAATYLNRALCAPIIDLSEFVVDELEAVSWMVMANFCKHVASLSLDAATTVGTSRRPSLARSGIPT